MSGRFSPSELPEPASYDEYESFTAVEKAELAEGSYTVGGEIPPGIYRIHSMELEKVVHVSSDHPLEGGIDADIYPASQFGYCTSYGGVKLVEGDTLTITGGDVRMFRS